jgi:hypothetical protein
VVGYESFLELAVMHPPAADQEIEVMQPGRGTCSSDGRGTVPDIAVFRNVMPRARLAVRIRGRGRFMPDLSIYFERFSLRRILAGS